MGILDKFKKKNQQGQNMYGPNSFNGYQQPYPNMLNPYGMRPQQQHQYRQHPNFHQPPQHDPYQQNYFQLGQQSHPQNHGYFQQPTTVQPQLNAHQQYINQNKLLQSVPFQNQPVIQSHNSNMFQQQQQPQSTQSQYPMTGQPPNRQEGSSTGFLSRMLGGDTSITGIIGNMQRAVQTAQQVTPMIQQYGPIVKNLPSLYRIFKEVNTDDPKETKKATKNENNVHTTTKEKRSRKKTIIDDEPELLQNQENKVKNESPKPKLFM